MTIEGSFIYNKPFDMVDAAVWARLPRFEKVSFTRSVITTGSVLYTLVHAELGEFARIEVRKTGETETTLVIEGPSIQPCRDLTPHEFADLAVIRDPELRRKQTQQLLDKIAFEHELRGRHINGLEESLAQGLLNKIDADFVLQELRTPQAPSVKKPSRRGKKRRPGNPGLSRAASVERMAYAQLGEEVKANDPSKVWSEIANDIGWPFGSGKSAVKKLQYARDYLKRAKDAKDEALLREIRRAKVALQNRMESRAPRSEV